MNSDLSKDRLVRNEQLLREKNIKTKNGIKRFFRSNRKVTAAPLAFICECSVLNCRKHVRLSIDKYEQLHRRKDRFTVVAGHETPSLEKILAKESDFLVVEKYQLNP